METTLSSKSILKTLADARSLGFELSLIYVALDDCERNIHRVQIRVAEGGHDVPDEDMRRRYSRSLAIAAEVIKIVDSAVVFDNSGRQHRLVLRARGGPLLFAADELPTWSLSLRAALSA